MHSFTSEERKSAFYGTSHTQKTMKLAKVVLKHLLMHVSFGPCSYPRGQIQV